MEIKEINVLALAYLGDSIYDIYIRSHLIKKGLVKVNELQKEATKYVSAKGQASFFKKLLELNYFEEDELVIINRGRNHKGSRHPKGTDIITYKMATGLEALIGYLYLENNLDRIKEIMKEITGD
ncbi:MAG: ribonuclease III [Firmicutes bacterium]|nr:ribonuclease III [Bacillota bacterium]